VTAFITFLILSCYPIDLTKKPLDQLKREWKIHIYYKIIKKYINIFYYIIDLFMILFNNN
jgi:hypothetical protein